MPKHISHKKRLLAIKTKYPRQIEVLLNLKRYSRLNKFSKEQKKKLFNVSDDDYEEWSKLVPKSIDLFNKYGEVVYEFVFKNFSDATKRQCCHEWNICKPTKNKFMSIVYSLTLNEIRLLNEESEDLWIKRQQIRDTALDIEKDYPNGLTRYKEENQNPTYEDILKAKGRIKEFQQIYDLSYAFKNWEKNQTEFCNEVWSLLGETLPNNGRYTYLVKYKRPIGNGKLEDSEFRIWQGFPNSVSPFYLEYQPSYYQTLFNQLSEIKKCSRYFLDSVYESFFSFILSFKEKFNTLPILIFADNGSDGWSEDVYNYHFGKIRDLLNDEEIPFYCLSEIDNIDNSSQTKRYVLFIDFYTINDFLKDNARKIIEHFDRNIPCLFYYSFIKNYDEKEIYELFKDKINWEQNIKEFIKEQFGRQNKNSFYTYYAITNTLIGEAANSSSVKAIWLDNPTNYDLKSIEKKEKGIISCDFTTDGWITSTRFERSGDTFNLDEVVEFTCDLFKEMGVLKMFYNKGSKAINYMNEHKILAYH